MASESLAVTSVECKLLICLQTVQQGFYVLRGNDLGIYGTYRTNKKKATVELPSDQVKGIGRLVHIVNEKISVIKFDG